MDVSAIASVAASLSQAKTAEAVDTAVLRKALDVAASSAQQLIEALPSPVSSNPSHLGQNVDTQA